MKKSLNLRKATLTKQSKGHVGQAYEGMACRGTSMAINLSVPPQRREKRCRPVVLGTVKLKLKQVLPAEGPVAQLRAAIPCSGSAASLPMGQLYDEDHGLHGGFHGNDTCGARIKSLGWLWPSVAWHWRALACILAIRWSWPALLWPLPGFGLPSFPISFMNVVS